jgi:ketose-bisphosphate aldolase
MSRVPLHHLVRNHVVPSFTCYGLEQVVGVVQAAEQSRLPTCLLLPPAALSGLRGSLLTRLLVEAAEEAQVPVAIQLDHSDDLEQMRQALDLGVTAVMADGSRLPFRRNAALVSAAVSLAAGYEASVEAELGHVPGDEDRADQTAVAEMTDPAQAAAFVEAASPHLLAVAVGNVHGSYQKPPSLDIGLLAKLASVAGVPLSIHGTSGIPERQVRAAVGAGARKFNVNTELRRAFWSTGNRVFGTNDPGVPLLEPLAQLSAATRSAAQPFFALDTQRHVMEARCGQR